MNANKLIEIDAVDNRNLNLGSGAERRGGKEHSERVSVDRDRYLTVADTADLLGVCGRTVYDALRCGRLRGQKFGRGWRVKPEWIDEWGIGNRDGGR